jgi:putative SOS response-associated peptidase YedK
MCGRYVAATPPDVLAAYFDVVEVKDDTLPPSWNVAPTREVYAVAERKLDEPTHTRQLGTFRWGLVPSWAKDPSIGSRLINARVESVADKPAFRKALTSRRCIIPADAFYEWEMRAGEKAAKSKRPKQPWVVRRADGEPFAFAGLWEVWRDAEDKWLRSCAIVTTHSTGQLADIHERCPVILERDAWDPWLDRSLTDEGQALALLQPPAPDLLDLYRVSRAVNDVKNDDPSLVEPGTVDEETAAEPTLFDSPAGENPA